jgi:hypothetical protein
MPAWYWLCPQALPVLAETLGSGGGAGSSSNGSGLEPPAPPFMRLLQCGIVPQTLLSRSGPPMSGLPPTALVGWQAELAARYGQAARLLQVHGVVWRGVGWG